MKAVMRGTIFCFWFGMRIRYLIIIHLHVFCEKTKHYTEKKLSRSYITTYNNHTSEEPVEFIDYFSSILVK